MSNVAKTHPVSQRLNLIIRVVHGRKFRCPDLTCNFVFPECQWDTYEGHKDIHLFNVGEPIPVAQKKRKASNSNVRVRGKIAKVESHSSALQTAASALMSVKVIPTRGVAVVPVSSVR